MATGRLSPYCDFYLTPSYLATALPDSTVLLTHSSVEMLFGCIIRVTKLKDTDTGGHESSSGRQEMRVDFSERTWTEVYKGYVEGFDTEMNWRDSQKWGLASSVETAKSSSNLHCFIFLIDGKDKMGRNYFKQFSNDEESLSVLSLICKLWSS
jgi:hypothetical protein